MELVSATYGDYNIAYAERSKSRETEKKWNEWIIDSVIVSYYSIELDTCVWIDLHCRADEIFWDLQSQYEKVGIFN